MHFSLHLLTSDGYTKIPSEKGQTKDKPIVSYEPEKVYVQAVDNKGLPLDQRIPVGSEVKIGTLLGVRKDFSLPVYSPVSGKVNALVKKKSTVVGRPVDFYEIVNDKKGERTNLEPLKDNPTKEDVVAKLKEGGIVGLGGAGFPAYIKYDAKDSIDTILVNAVECEPYLTTDYMSILKSDLDPVFKALSILAKAVGAKKVLLVSKKEKTEILSCFQAKVDELKDPLFEVKAVKNVYPSGFERNLIDLTLHRHYDRLPSEAHCIVSNFATVEAIAALFLKGETLSRKVITVAGEVKEPKNISVPYGVLAKELIAFAGGYAIDKGTLIFGGPMCGEAQLSDDIPLQIQNDALTVLKPKTLYTEECLHCGNCSAHCPLNLQPVCIQDAAKAGDYEKAFDLKALECVNCGVCSAVCPSHIDVAAHVMQSKLMIKFKVPRASKKPDPKK